MRRTRDSTSGLDDTADHSRGASEAVRTQLVLRKAASDRPRVVVHIDLDGFYAAVERRRLRRSDTAKLAVQQWDSLIAVCPPTIRGSPRCTLCMAGHQHALTVRSFAPPLLGPPTSGYSSVRAMYGWWAGRLQLPLGGRQARYANAQPDTPLATGTFKCEGSDSAPTKVEEHAARSVRGPHARARVVR